MLGTLSEFTLAQLLQLFALSEKSGTITVHASQRHTRLLIESDKVVGLGAPDTDARRQMLDLELLPDEIRAALENLTPRAETPGLSLVAGNLVEPVRWEHYVSRRFEQDIYPLLNEDDGAFEITVERIPPAPIRVSATVQQIILDSSRWEAESEALRAEGYNLDRVWQRTDKVSDATPGAFTRAMWLIWAILLKPASIADAARRLSIPDLAAATAVRRLHNQGLLQRAS